MSRFLIYTLSLYAAVQVFSRACVYVDACSQVKKSPPYVDHGTCGNACCKMVYKFKYDDVTTLKAIKKVLSSGGPDGNYSPRPMNDGNVGYSDYRKYHGDVSFMGKFNHMTTGPKHYNDTIYFSIKPLVSTSADNENTGCTVEAFSISLIGGAYGDGDAQNYMNIDNFMSKVTLQNDREIVFGCGKTLSNYQNITFPHEADKDILLIK
mmetsp:Transcript_6590/g.8368  ORF Transcript_6590/g.8368 Transcript_6590/m.8368 type:complete len:208 (+) Transcript_6590:240-863(+)|eukprot:CAMPEP_0204883562 /NCGR_PEP_ID=MMETSP1349-20130617/5765_1 /ASSEMBLY_ACC=CAM_ASM_000710 /TAXON_ID=215587 /ORGANISM="Aplanochytrium stocchinoi, Strain GSBS06" /LENGTH=207 /DNA_ID=CAMNT_0052043619 /DNA_START=174 /DNA_END=797 /DNA_ORIENTATION=+